MKKTLFSIAALLIAAVGGSVAFGQTPHVYINPGHGGHESNDRNVVVPPFAAGDTAGFWESNASLKKGFALQQMLRLKGYQTSISRVTNDEASDLALSTIVALCNQSGADVFYAIHSNATGMGEGYRVNFPIGLYRGYTGSPQVAGSDSLAKCLGPFLLANQSTVWSRNEYTVYGDWTFYPDWGTQGLGVLRGNKTVSMLNEGSFHDYIPETYRLINPYYCWVEGFNFSLGADSYFHRLDKYDKGFLTGNVRDSRLLRDASYVMLGDDKRLPVNNATAYLIDADGKTIDTCLIDDLNNGIYLFKFITPGNYKVRLTEASHYEQTKDVVITANGITYCNFDLNRVRNTPPEVVSYSPVWTEGGKAAKCNEPIVLQFNWDMDQPTTESAFSISPAVEGTFKWEDTNYRLVFTPDDAYKANTLYTVTLKKSAQHAGGTCMDSDFSFKFTTQSRDHSNVIAMFPAEGDQVHYKGLYVELRIDSMMNTSGINKNIIVTDDQGNQVSYNKRSFRYNKKGEPYGSARLTLQPDLTIGGTYKVTYSKEISDTAGLKLPQDVVCTFTAVDAGADKTGTTAVENFDDATKFQVNADAGSGYSKANLTAVTGTNALFGTAALQLAYNFDGNDGKVAIDLSSAADEGFTAADNAGIHIFGDMSFNAVYGKFVSGTDVKLVKLSDVSYHGWRYCNVPLNSLDSGLSYKFEGLVVEKNHSVMGASGTMRFDNLLRDQSSGMAEVEAAGVKVKAQGDYVVASADGFIQRIELYSADGRLAASGNGNYINVSSMPVGAYVAKVYVSGLVAVKKIMVSHR